MKLLLVQINNQRSSRPVKPRNDCFGYNGRGNPIRWKGQVRTFNANNGDLSRINQQLKRIEILFNVSKALNDTFKHEHEKDVLLSRLRSAVLHRHAPDYTERRCIIQVETKAKRGA
jgi:hypothetical protein